MSDPALGPSPSTLTLTLPAAFDEAMRVAVYTSTGRLPTGPISDEARKAFVVGLLHRYLAANPFHRALADALATANGCDVEATRMVAEELPVSPV